MGSWESARRYYRALRQVEADLDEGTNLREVWRPEYADIFGSPARLLLALRTHWTTMLRAQVEWDPDDNWRRIVATHHLAAEHPGLVRALSRQATRAAAQRREAIAVGAA